MTTPLTGNEPGILVVDGEDLILAFLAFALQEKGFLVWTASPGPQVREVLKENLAHIKAALVDLGDGLQSLEFVREMAPQLPCCVMSADLKKAEMVKLGANAFLQKPFALSDLVDTLKDLTSK